MTDYRRRNLDETQTTPPLGPLLGGQPMKRDRASTVHATGDRVPRHGRRILLQAGLHGADGWHIPDTMPGGIYPLMNVSRVAARSPAITLTPGHFVRIVCAVNPSGMTEDIANNPEGAQGSLTVTAAYNNGATNTVTRTISFPGSLELYGQQPSSAGGAWALLRRYRSTQMWPDNLNNIGTLSNWIDGPVTVELTLEYNGSPRVVDVVVYEEPLALSYALDAGDWIAPMHAGPGGGNLGQLQGPVPVIKRSSGDPGGGAEIICDAARRQAQELGPVLVAATAWDEGSQTVTALEALARAVTSTSFVELWTDSTAAHADADAGWSLSSGGNARRVQESEERVVLRDTDNAVAVRCWIYCRLTTAGHTATVRFEAEDYSIAELTTTSDSWGWVSTTGHMRCGLGAQDPTVFQVRAKVGSGTFQWRYIFVTFENV